DEGRPRLLRVVEVAEREPPGVGHPTDLARARLDPTQLVVEHTGLIAGLEAGEARYVVSGLEPLPPLYPALGRTEAVDDGPTGEQFTEADLERRRDRPTTVGDGEEVGDVPTVGVLLPRLHQRASDRISHDSEGVDLVVCHRVPDRLGL